MKAPTLALASILAMLLAPMAEAAGSHRGHAAVPPPRPSVAEVLDETLEPQRAFGAFRQEGLPLAVLAESRHFRVAAGVSPRRVAGIYFVRKSEGPSP